MTTRLQKAIAWAERAAERWSDEHAEWGSNQETHDMYEAIGSLVAAARAGAMPAAEPSIGQRAITLLREYRNPPKFEMPEDANGWGDQLMKDMDELLREAAEPKRVQGPEASPWPPRDVVARLMNAVNHLRTTHNCDCHGYEEVYAAMDVAYAWLHPAESAQAGRDKPWADATATERQAYQMGLDARGESWCSICGAAMDEHGQRVQSTVPGGLYSGAGTIGAVSDAEPQRVQGPVWRCAGCGEEFDTECDDHARAEDDGHGNAIPVQCGPVYRVGDEPPMGGKGEA